MIWAPSSATRAAIAPAEISSANGSDERFHAGGDDHVPNVSQARYTCVRMVGMATDVDPQLGVLLGETTTEIDVARKNRVFCNRNLRMDTIEMIGFDMDYTLALYHQDRLEQLSMELTLQKLVDKHGYAPAILQLSYDPRWAIRGLVVDKKYGNVFKADRHSYVGRCYHGFRELDHDERKATYRNEKINLSSDRYEWIDTLFALPEAVMYTTLVDWHDRQGARGRLRQAVHRHPHRDRRGPPRRHAEERDQGATSPRSSSRTRCSARPCTSSAARARSCSCSPTRSTTTPRAS